MKLRLCSRIMCFCHMKIVDYTYNKENSLYPEIANFYSLLTVRNDSSAYLLDILIARVSSIYSFCGGCNCSGS